jgi:hypothetical protein
MGFAKGSTHHRNDDGNDFARKTYFLEPDQSDLPCPDLFAKIFRFAIPPNHFYIPAIPSHREGRFAIVTDVGAGCGGR